MTTLKATKFKTYIKEKYRRLKDTFRMPRFNRLAGTAILGAMIVGALACSEKTEKLKQPTRDAGIAASIDVGFNQDAGHKPKVDAGVSDSGLPPDPVCSNLHLLNFQSPESLGDSAHPVKMIWAVDFEGPFNRGFFNGDSAVPQVSPAFSLIVQNYVNTGLLQIMLNHILLDFHSKDEFLAQAVVCGNVLNQGGSFTMLGHILSIPYQDIQRTSLEQDRQLIRQFASSIGSNLAAFDTCMEDSTVTLRIQNESMRLFQAGISGTPYFVILNTANGKCVVVAGALPFSAFQAAIMQVQ